MLATTLSFATLFFSLFTAGSALTVDTPENIVQCQQATFSWSAGNDPYNVDVFTSCDDSNDSPIVSFLNVAGTSVDCVLPLVSGEGFFLAVTDTLGQVYYSLDGFVGGNTGADEDSCKKYIQDNNLETQSIDASQTTPDNTTSNGTTTTDNTDSTNDNTGNTQPNTPSGGDVGVANAEQTPSSSAAQPSSTAVGSVQGALGSGAFTNAAPPAGLVMTLLGAGLLALL